MSVESDVLFVDQNEKLRFLDTTKLYTKIQMRFFTRALGVVVDDSASGLRVLPRSNIVRRYRLQFILYSISKFIAGRRNLAVEAASM